MTRAATKSTSDANGGESQNREETMLSAVVGGNLAAAAAYGMDRAALMRAANVNESDLADPDGRIPFERYVALWEAICARPEAMSFALWLAKTLNIEALGVVGYVMQHAGDVRAALRCFERFNMLLGDSVGPRIAEEGETIVLHRTEPPRIVRLAAFSMAAPLGTVTLLRELVRMGASEQVALDVAFQHPPIASDLHAAYEEAIGCKVRYSAEDTRIVLPRSLLERPLFAPHAGLFAYLEKHAIALQSRVADSASMAGKVRTLVVERLREGEPTPRAIAKKLALSERTLQRRLRAENVTFADLVDAVRADLARMYLNDPKLAVFEVAFLLGYSEPSAFNRAFRRWTGQSPSQFRRQGG